MCCRCCPSWLTFNCVSVSLFLLYCGFLSTTLVNVLLPGGLFGYTLAPGARTLDPLWRAGQPLSVRVYLSDRHSGVPLRVLERNQSTSPRLPLLPALPAASTSDAPLALHPSDGAPVYQRALVEPRTRADSKRSRLAREKRHKSYAAQERAEAAARRPRGAAQGTSVLLWETHAPVYGWGTDAENDKKKKKSDGVGGVGGVGGPGPTSVRLAVNLTEGNLPGPLWDAALLGKPLFVHAVISHRHAPLSERGPGGNAASYSPLHIVRAVTKTTRHTTQKAVKSKWRLVPQFCDVCGDPNARRAAPTGEPLTAKRDAPPSPHWKPRAAFRIVVDYTRFPHDKVPPLIVHHLSRTARRLGKYPPFSFADEVGLTTDKLVPLNETVTMLPLELEFAPSSLPRWQLGALMDQSMSMMQSQWGAEEKDSDELRYMLTETSPSILLLTLVVSLLHTLFDVLAFKSDIQFWRKLKTLRGLSARAVVNSLVCQVVVVAYLHHEETSKLVLLPAAFGCVLQVWKVWKVVWSGQLLGGGSAAAAVADSSSSSSSSSASSSSSSSSSDDDAKMKKKKMKEEEAARARELAEVATTQYYDRLAGSYLGHALYPLVVGSALYSMLCGSSAGWYDWIVSSAVTTVYTFGFIAMTPQLFINYKLKSVAHLPWRFLVLRALNTFIDDLFAFIIRMPTMHRLSCFRDDLVFFIYMYQRWCYPVDATRQSVGVDEDELVGVGGEEEEEEEKKVGPGDVAVGGKRDVAPVNGGEVQEGMQKEQFKQQQQQQQHQLQQESLLTEGVGRATILLEKGIAQYKEYYGKRNTPDASTPLKRADDSFNGAATIAKEYLSRVDGESCTPAGDVVAGQIRLLRGRALNCRMLTSDALGDLEEAVQCGYEAARVFKSIDDKRRLYENCNNLIFPLLDLWKRDRTRTDLIDRTIEATEEMQRLLNGPGATELNRALGDHRRTRAQKLAKHLEQAENLRAVKRGEARLTMSTGNHREITFEHLGQRAATIQQGRSSPRRRKT
jgi:hypothetical protein